MHHNLMGLMGLIAGELIDGHRFRSLERWSRKWNTRGKPTSIGDFSPHENHGNQPEAKILEFPDASRGSKGVNVDEIYKKIIFADAL